MRIYLTYFFGFHIFYFWLFPQKYIEVDSGKPLELRLYKINEYGGISHVGSKPLVGNNTNSIESFLSRQNFVAGFDYFVCVYEVEIGKLNLLLLLCISNRTQFMTDHLDHRTTGHSLSLSDKTDHNI